MFNRQREIRCLSEVLKNKPEFSIITGPVDSGKTRLVEYLLHNKTKRNVPICPINLRKGNYYRVQSLVDSLSLDMGSWLYRIKKALSESGKEVSASAAELASVSLKLQRKVTPSDSLNYLLKEVANGLPARTLLRGKQQPVLFIDEANRLRTLLRDVDHGQSALESLFEWLILHTKEKQQFHVVMATSDSFFNVWVEKFIGSSRYTTYVIGYLEKSCAREYWETKVLKDYILPDGIPPPNFDDVYAVCGGSIHLMNKFMGEYCFGESEISEDPANFHMVLQEKRRLTRALTPSQMFPEIDPPKWSESDLIKVMKMLTKEEIIMYNTLCKELGSAVINSMIQYNLIHLRPTARLSFDVPKHRDPIITAKSPAALVAMKSLLLEVGSES